MRCKFLVVLLCSVVLSLPLEQTEERGYEMLKKSNRVARSPTLFKKGLGGLLFGGGHGSYGGGEHTGGGGVNHYVTNINNYGPSGHGGSQYSGNHGHGQAASLVGAAAVAGGHGGQSQSAAFAFGPHTASFSQSQGGGKPVFDLFGDY